MNQARTVSAVNRFGAILVLFADLPLVNGTDVTEFATAEGQIVIAPDQNGIGTNGLVLRRGDVNLDSFAFQFGIDSFRSHVDESRRLGIEPTIVTSSGLAFDLDTPEDLSNLISYQPVSHPRSSGDRIMTAPAIQIYGLSGIPEVQPGDDVVELIVTALEADHLTLEDGDVLIVTHKVVSKAEGQLINLGSIEPSPLAIKWAETWSKDARQVEVVLREATRIVRMERGILIAETEHGFICANAGVDASNVHAETVCLLPRDPDGSAEAIRSALSARYGVRIGVIISDSFGRPWRNGIVNVAIGVAGIPALADYRGQTDAAGYSLHVTVLAIADEMAAAAELIMNKLDARPVALLRGYTFPVEATAGTGQDLVMDSSKDLFR